MDGIRRWLSSLVYYLILMTMVLNLLPDRRYEKYLRLFAGAIFLLLFFEPFTQLTGLEQAIAGQFERLSFQNDVSILRRELEEADGERLLRLLSGYREAVEQDLFLMAEGGDILECLEAEAELDEDGSKDAFGTLLQVKLRVRAKRENPGLSREESREVRAKANREMEGLKRRIGEYYGLEERKITIVMEDE